jgi:hypothetical protein
MYGYLPLSPPPAQPILPMRVFRLVLTTLCCGVATAAKGAGAGEASARVAGASLPIPPDLTVAADGTGNFKTVQDALNSIARGSRELDAFHQWGERAHYPPAAEKRRVTFTAGAIMLGIDSFSCE